MESVERLFFTSWRAKRREPRRAPRGLGPPRAGAVTDLYELSHHGGPLGRTRPGERGHAFGDGAVGLLVRQRRALRVNRARQHPQQVHVAQTRRVGRHQRLKRDGKTGLRAVKCRNAVPKARKTKLPFFNICRRTW